MTNSILTTGDKEGVLISANQQGEVLFKNVLKKLTKCKSVEIHKSVLDNEIKNVPRHFLKAQIYNIDKTLVRSGKLIDEAKAKGIFNTYHPCTALQISEILIRNKKLKQDEQGYFILLNETEQSWLWLKIWHHFWNSKILVESIVEDKKNQTNFDSDCKIIFKTDSMNFTKELNFLT